MNPVKLRVGLLAVADFAIDVLLPTLVYLALTPTDLSAAVRLTIGGFFVAAKATAGRVHDTDRLDVDAGEIARGFATAGAIAAGAAAVTVACAVAGTGDGVAIGAGSAVLALVAGVRFVRGPRALDGFAVLVLLEVAASVVLTAVSDDARFVLARPAAYTAIAGLYVLTTVRASRPFMMQVSKPMAAAGDPLRAEAFERAGRESAPFRRTEQAMTAGLGLVLLAEAVLRVATVYGRPAADVGSTSLLSQLPSVALFVGFFAAVALLGVPRATREVDALMPAHPDREEPSCPAPSKA